jgi:hypothetical protein
MRAPTSDNIYTTSVQGIGISVKVWLNITGNMEGDTDFNADYSEHYIGDADFYWESLAFFYDKALYYTQLPGAACRHWRRYRQQ